MTTMPSHIPRDPSLSFLGPLPMLTAHEEATLLRQVARARLEQATAHPDALLLEAGQRARTTLIAAGQRLVIYLAKRFLARCHSMTLSDFIQEGTLGLIQAIDSYASTQGYPYATWVELKIKDAIRTALYQRDRLIRLPARQVDAARRLQGVEQRLSLTLGHAPTSRELAQAMQVQERKLALLLCLEDYTPCSLHTPLEDEEDEHGLLLDCIPAPDLVLPAPGWQVVEQQQDAKAHERRLPRLAQVHALLGAVAERERAVIILRYGLGDAQENDRPLGYEEIGRRLALNPGHVCLIEQRALRKLRLALTYYTPALAAARLGVRVQQLDRLVKRGKLTRQVVPPNAQGALPASRGRRAGGPGRAACTRIPGSGLRSACGTGTEGQPGWPVPANTDDRQSGRCLSPGATTGHGGRGTAGLTKEHTRMIPLTAGWKRHRCLRWAQQYTRST